MRKTIEDMVQQEVMCCMSSLVSTLAQGAYTIARSRTGARDFKQAQNLGHLCDQASELAAPVPDYEEAAIQAGWPSHTLGLQEGSAAALDEDRLNKDPQAWCEFHGHEPYDREVFEHWAVTTWFAEKLIAQGEKVDTDFAGVNVWARTTTGQSISMDGCIKNIYDAMMAPVDA